METHIYPCNFIKGKETGVKCLSHKCPSSLEIKLARPSASQVVHRPTNVGKVPPF